MERQARAGVPLASLSHSLLLVVEALLPGEPHLGVISPPPIRPADWALFQLQMMAWASFQSQP
jgi:hypothetical protein